VSETISTIPPFNNRSPHGQFRMRMRVGDIYCSDGLNYFSPNWEMRCMHAEEFRGRCEMQSACKSFLKNLSLGRSAGYRKKQSFLSSGTLAFQPKISAPLPQRNLIARFGPFPVLKCKTRGIFWDERHHLEI